MSGVCAAADLPATDGLVKTKIRGFDQAWFVADADLGRYESVSIAPVQISYRQDWKRRNRTHRGLNGRRMDQQDVDRITAAMTEEFDQVFPAAVVKGGLELAPHRGPRVLQLRPTVADFWLNHPDLPAATHTEVLVDHAGEATLILELFDAESGSLIGWASDRRETHDSRHFRRATRVYNRSEFRRLFQRWGRGSAAALVQQH